MRILSLFDGMACGMIAMLAAGVEVESYDAYEIDKYAIKAATHNFPTIQEHGDVFEADFTQYEGVDFLVGGSPCTHWSIAQTKNRETEVSRDEKGNIMMHSSGIGFELFSQYLRALEEAKPSYFIYENNKSMSKDIRAAITECFGFEPICINSALVSAQNRQRLYWVGRRNEDGTYSKVNVEQPADRGILLKDVLDNAVARDLTCNDKSYTLTASYDGACAWNTIERHQRSMVAEPVEPRCVAQCGRYPENPKSRVAGLPTEQMFEASADGKTNTLTTVQKDNYVAEPINATADGKAQCLRATCYKDGIRNIVGNDVDCRTGVAESVDVFNSATVRRAAEDIATKKGYIPKMWCPYNRTEIIDKSPTLSTGSMVTSGCATIVAEPITDICQVGAMPMPNGELSTSAGFRVCSTEAKGRYLCANGGGAGAKTGLYAIPYAIEFDDDGRPIKAIGKDGKEITIYEVRGGKITIKGKQYPIKLRDGYYIIRKLTVSECKRLQTVPEWYDFSVISNSQAYKCLGNGWTCEVITHLIKACLETAAQQEQYVTVGERYKLF